MKTGMGKRCKKLGDNEDNMKEEGGIMLEETQRCKNAVTIGKKNANEDSHNRK